MRTKIPSAAPNYPNPPFPEEKGGGSCFLGQNLIHVLPFPRLFFPNFFFWTRFFPWIRSSSSLSCARLCLKLGWIASAEVPEVLFSGKSGGKLGLKGWGGMRKSFLGWVGAVSHKGSGMGDEEEEERLIFHPHFSNFRENRSHIPQLIFGSPEMKKFQDFGSHIPIFFPAFPPSPSI